MPHPSNYLSVNSALWDEKAKAHFSSEFYDTDAFRAGANTVNDIELSLLGDVAGKRILHLQCHFGQDSLSLARMGAIVTGVDFSKQAIDYARQLNNELGLNATFISCDVYNLPNVLAEQFDIVFTSYGTIVWLPDLVKWSAVIAHFLKPGGRFVFADFHPVIMMHDDDLTGVKYSYFNTGVIEEVEQGTYADRNAAISLTSLTWNHSLSDVLEALLGSGLTLSAFKEYNYSPYGCFGNMEQLAPKKFMIKGIGHKMPLVFALAAVKPIGDAQS